MNQGGDNNYYNQEYRNNGYGRQNPYYGQPQPPLPPIQPQPPRHGKQGGGSFLLGLLLGLVLASLIGGITAAGMKIYDLVKENDVKQVNGSGGAESVLNEDTEKKLSIIEEAINEYYYKDEDIDADTMIEGMYAGMVDALGDPYSVYYTAEEWDQLMQDTEGIYYGIGAYLSLDPVTGYGKVNGVISGTPAEEAGLRENDLIYMIDGENAYGLDLSEIVARVKGEEGTIVHLTIYREGETDYLEIDVERRKIESPTVNYEMYDNGIGYIQITEFDDVTTDQFTEALAVIKGSKAKGLILDLRGNPGGSLPVVVDIAREILPKGLIVYTEDKNGKRDKYTCDGQHELKMPLVVLVNSNSASASEILAGAIKDYNAGVLVGTTTFGKGIVQRVIPLSDGTALKLTISSYYTPNGNNIHGVGIEPDIVCEFDSEAYYEEDIDNQLERAMQEIEKMVK